MADKQMSQSMGVQDVPVTESDAMASVVQLVRMAGHKTQAVNESAYVCPVTDKSLSALRA